MASPEDLVLSYLERNKTGLKMLQKVLWQSYRVLHLKHLHHLIPIVIDDFTGILPVRGLGKRRGVVEYNSSHKSVLMSALKAFFNFP